MWSSGLADYWGPSDPETADPEKPDPGDYGVGAYYSNLVFMTYGACPQSLVRSVSKALENGYRETDQDQTIQMGLRMGECCKKKIGRWLESRRSRTCPKSHS